MQVKEECGKTDLEEGIGRYKMKTVLDEILSDEPKYRIKDGNGNILYDNLVIEQITPATQEGTPLDKALFDSIHSHLLFNGRYVTLSGVSTSDYTMPYLSGSNHVGYTMTWEYSNVDDLPSTPYDLFSESLSVYPFIKSNGYLRIDVELPTYINPTKCIDVGGMQTTKLYGKLNVNDAYEEISWSDNHDPEHTMTITSNKMYKYIRFEYLYNSFAAAYGIDLSIALISNNISKKLL